jgi:ribosomal protein L6P/L9E
MTINASKNYVTLPGNTDINIGYLEDFTFVTLLTPTDRTRNLIIPNFVTLSRLGQMIKYEFDPTTSLKSVKEFTEAINNWLIGSFVRKLFRCKLIMKGLGLKAGLSENRRLISLKLGFSRIIKLRVPYTLDVKVAKLVITVQGYNFSEVGDFSERLCRMRTPDAYKGKGIWYRNRSRTLKQLKKK